MATTKVVPLINLPNGNGKMPAIGLGTWKSKPGEVYEAVKSAILESGYRHIDCALVYGNEEEVGKALSEAISKGVSREELFVTSKCWNTFHSRPRVVECCRKSLKNLGLDYLDMYLIHWPMGAQEGGEMFPKNADDKMIYSDVDFLDTWKGMEDCVKAGLVKSIGVSNFNSKQIDRILDNCEIKLSNLQVECHPYLNQSKLIEYCKTKNIVVTAYAPLGSPDRPWAKPEDPSLMDEPKIKAIAAKHNKSSAQVLLRYQIQRGVVPIPKSVTKSRIASNIQVFDFELSPEEVETIDKFNNGFRACALGWWSDHPHFPFSIPY